MFGRKKKETNDQSYWGNVKRQFRKDSRAVIATYLVVSMAFVAVFADFLANEKPIICKFEGRVSAPVIKGYFVEMGIAKWPKEFQNAEWSKLEYDFVLWPLVPYLPTNMDGDIDNQFVGPFEKQEVKSTKWRHWLGTDIIGRDVMSGMIHGTRVAFLVGIISMSIATLIGIFMGSFAGFFGDNELKISIASLTFGFLALVPAFFYGFTSRTYVLADSFEIGFFHWLGNMVWGLIIVILVMAAAYVISLPFKRIPILGKKVPIPVDIMITRLIEVVVSIPVLVLVLAFVAIAKPSIYNVMLIIGCVRWTGIARFTRAELLRQKRLEYVEAASALGFSRLRSLVKHALPNSLSPVFIAIAFGIAASILIEAFLSFLGVGVPVETVTWGQLLAASRKASDAWWLAIFPGFAIFLTVTMFNLIGEGLTDALDPRQKR